jgi:hypothetical protein
MDFGETVLNMPFLNLLLCQAQALECNLVLVLDTHPPRNLFLRRRRTPLANGHLTPRYPAHNKQLVNTRTLSGLVNDSAPERTLAVDTTINIIGTTAILSPRKHLQRSNPFRNQLILCKAIVAILLQSALESKKKRLPQVVILCLWETKKQQ